MGMYVPPQYGQGGNSQNLVQLALAIKAQKMQQSGQEKEEAFARIKMYMENPLLLSTMDHKQVEKDFKKVGMKFGDQQPANPADAAKTAPPSGDKGSAAQPSGVNVDHNALEALARTTQGSKGGAQAANPPSSNAGSKAPGGGVTPSTGSVNLKGQAQDLAAQADEAFKVKYGNAATLYKEAFAQLDQRKIVAEHNAHIADLSSRAEGGDIRAHAELFREAGKTLSFEEAANFAATHPTASTEVEGLNKQILDVMRHNEDPSKFNDRVNTAFKNLSSTPEIAGILGDPVHDMPRIARALASGDDIPKDISMRPFSLSMLDAEDKRTKQMVEQGMPIGVAMLVSRGSTFSMMPSEMLPAAYYDQYVKTLQNPGVQNSMAQELGKQPVSSREAGAKEVEAAAKMKQANTNWEELQMKFKDKPDDDFLKTFGMVIDLLKAKQSVPKEIMNALNDKVGAKYGLSPHQVDGILEYLNPWTPKYDATPDEAAKAAAREAAYGKQSMGTPAQQATVKRMQERDQAAADKEAKKNRDQIKQERSHSSQVDQPTLGLNMKSLAVLAALAKKNRQNP